MPAGGLRRAVRGRVVALHVKPAVAGEPGLPKRPVAEARVTAQGMEGDHNAFRTRKKAGDPDMALLLHTRETLAALAAEGWPVAPGDLGENVLLEGVPYEALAPGVRVRLGEAVAEVSKRCDPCTSLYVLPYAGAARGPAFLRATVGRRGWYARVVQEGVVRVGDAVEVASG